MEHEAIQKIKSTVNRGITTISVKTASSLEKSKIRTHIETLENEVRSMIINIGECTFEIWQSDADYEQISELCKTVAQKKSEIESLYQELSNIDSRDSKILGNQEGDKSLWTVCPQCGEQYFNHVNFCRKCGTRLGKE